MEYKEVGKKRIKQLVEMMIFLSGKSREELESLVESTVVGIELMEGSEILLYDQQTANLYEIRQELEDRGLKEWSNYLSNENIVRGMRWLYEDSGDRS